MTMTTVLDKATDPIDAIPELCHYEDTGCEASESCLGCPLPKCKHDDPLWYQRNRRLAKDFQVMYTIQLEGLSVEEAAERFSGNGKDRIPYAATLPGVSHRVPAAGGGAGGVIWQASEFKSPRCVDGLQRTGLFRRGNNDLSSMNS